MNRNRALTVGLALAMVLSVLAPLGTVAADSHGLEISVAQEEDVVVTVTENDSPVENAAVNVTTVDENDSYAGIGSYETENGTVDLPVPGENVSVSVKANHDNETVSETVLLVADDGEADGSFGALVSQFVNNLRNDDVEVDDEDSNKTFGQKLASLVVAKNPGNAPDHAGPKNDGERGPPGHANGNADSSSDDESNDEVENEDDDDKRGPPAHAGPKDKKDTDAKAVEEDDGDAGDGDDDGEEDGDRAEEEDEENDDSKDDDDDDGDEDE